jgi:hypothetical protein
MVVVLSDVRALIDAEFVEVGMSTGIYTVIATFPCEWPADLVATGVKPVSP